MITFFSMLVTCSFRWTLSKLSMQGLLAGRRNENNVLYLNQWKCFEPQRPAARSLLWNGTSGVREGIQTRLTHCVLKADNQQANAQPFWHQNIFISACLQIPLYFFSDVLGFWLLWRHTVTMATLRKENIYLGLGASLLFRSSVHCHHGRQHGEYTGRHGTGKVAESSISGSKGSRKTEWD